MLLKIEMERLRLKVAHYKIRELEDEPWKDARCYKCGYWTARDVIDRALMFGICGFSHTITSNMSKCQEFRRASR